MHNVVLIIHLVFALCLIGVVLLQRSEGGALGIGGGGGGLVSQRGAATALSKVTWGLAAGFLCTSILLTVLASGGNQGSILDRLTQPDGNVALPELPATGGTTGTPAGGTTGAPAGGTTGNAAGGAATSGNAANSDQIPPAPAETMPAAPKQ